MTTQKAIKMKDGSTLAKGLPCSFQQDKPWICLVNDGSANPCRVRVTSAFHAPDTDQIGEWVMDSICDSIAGNQVEPDGWDSEGTPSWLLALGMV